MNLVDAQEENKYPEAKVIELKPAALDEPVSLWRELRPALLTAMMLFFVVSAYFLWPRDEITHLATADENEIVLPDDTQVVLEEGAILTIQELLIIKKKEL